MKIIIFLILVLVIFGQLHAQETRIDSSETKRKLAFADARRFRPTKQIRKSYRNRTLSNTSDYFNPTIQSTSNSGFLRDSVYVKAYKEAAYKNTVHQIKSVGIIIGATVVVVIIVVIVAIIKTVDSVGSGLASVVNGY